MFFDRVKRFVVSKNLKIKKLWTPQTPIFPLKPSINRCYDLLSTKKEPSEGQ